MLLPARRRSVTGLAQHLPAPFAPSNCWRARQDSTWPSYIPNVSAAGCGRGHVRCTSPTRTARRRLVVISQPEQNQPQSCAESLMSG